MFILNLIPGINHEITLQRARAEGNAAPYYIKKDFVIDPSLPKPNIYWMHMDGMTSPGVVERFWGESMEYAREELKKRGFLLYEDAVLESGSTRAGLTSLFSPAFYDSFYREQLEQINTELLIQRNESLVNKLATVGLTYDDDLFPNFEFFRALTSSGYSYVLRSKVRGGLADGMPSPQVFLENNSHAGIFDMDNFGDLPQLLTLTTPLNIINKNTGEEDNDSLLEMQEGNFIDGYIAEFKFRSFVETKLHLHYDRGQDVHISDVISMYPLLYEETVESLLYYIDATLNDDPDSVIIIQGDHGIHDIPAQDYLLSQGYSLETVLELNHSVISAVRIPPKYGGLDEPIAPLNITRELVNRFVGENYILLSD